LFCTFKTSVSFLNFNMYVLVHGIKCWYIFSLFLNFNVYGLLELDNTSNYKIKINRVEQYHNSTRNQRIQFSHDKVHQLYFNKRVSINMYNIFVPFEVFKIVFFLHHMYNNYKLWRTMTSPIYFTQMLRLKAWLLSSMSTHATLNLNFFVKIHCISSKLKAW
jgi:hypothetical protein